MLTRPTLITIVLLAAVTVLLITGSTVSQVAYSDPLLTQTTVTLDPVADAGIESGAPDTHFGHTDTLPVYYGGQNEIGRALIRFNLAAAVPAEASIDSARLDVFLQYGDGANPVNVVASLITEDWSEPGVTWSNQPATDGPFMASLVDTAPGYKSLDVTDIVRAWHNAPHYGLRLNGPEGETSYGRTFASRENGENPPQLVVTYHLPAPTYVLAGRVYAGEVGDESAPLPGVTVELYGSNNPEVLGAFIASTTTDPTGWYGLTAPDGFEFYTILETDLPGYTSVGATSVGGTVINSNRIQYALPLEGKTLTGNKFWDRPEVAETPTPTSTATRTPTRSPTPTGTLPPDCTELLANGNFETGVLDPWAGAGAVGLGFGRSSAHGAWLGGTDNAEGELLQVVNIPAGANPVRWEFWWLAESEIEQPGDAVEVVVQYGDEQVDHLRTLPAVAPLGQWRQAAVDLTDYGGEVAVTFLVHTDGEVPSTFSLDDVSVKACGVPPATPTATASLTGTGPPPATATPSPTGPGPATATATATPSATRTATATPRPTSTSTATATRTPTVRPTAICALEDVSPGPGSTPQPVWWNASRWGKMLSLSITGVPGIVGPPVSWTTLNGDILVEGLAAADQDGKLIMFYWYPGSDWKAVNITEKTGRTIAVERPEYWLFTDTAGPFEKLAAPAANGDLLVFAWRAETDWQATNLSSATGKKITGPVTAWVTPFGNQEVEHLAAWATNNDLLVFYRQTGGTWQVTNVTTLTGQTVGGPATSWTLEGGSETVERLAAPAPNGDLLLFTYQPSTNWQVTNLSQLTAQKVSGRATDWIAPTGPRAENLAVRAPNGDLVIFTSDPIEGGWYVTNVTSATGQKVSGSATSWLTQSGSTWYEHLAAPGPNQHLYAFHKATGGSWQVRDVTNITGQTITHPPTSWVTPNGPVLVEHLAAPSWDGRLYLFYWEPSHDWKTVNVSLTASGRTVYAASERAGVWRSRDYGINWAQLTRPQPAQGAQTVGGLDVPVVHDVAVSPKDPRLVVAAAGNDHRSPSRSGIYRSTDGGATWTRVHQFTCNNQVEPATQVIFAPDDPTTLYAAGGCAIAIGTNSGANWTDVTLPGTDDWVRAWHVAVSPLQPGDERRAFACGSGTLWYSPDSGRHWYRDNAAGQSLPAGFCATTTLGNGDAAQTLAIEPGKPDHVYLAYQNNANGPSYFHPVEKGPDGAHCNNPVVYDDDNDGTYDSGELHIWGLSAVAGATLKDDPKIMFVDTNSNTSLDGNEAVVHDTDGDGLYSTLSSGKNEAVMRGTAPSIGTHLQDDPKIKHVDMGTSFGPRGCGEGSLWYGDLSSFDPARPNDLRGTWSQLPGPPVYWGNSASGAAFVYTHPIASGYLVFLAEQDTLHVSVGKPSVGSWHRLDGWDASENKRQNKLSNSTTVHVDPHGLAISPDFDLTLKPVRDERAPYNLNMELDQCLGGRLWYSNDGGVDRSDDCGQTWIRTYAGLSTLAAVNVGGAARPGTAPALYFGTGDNDDFYSLDGGATWRSGVDICGDCNAWWADPAQPNRVVGLSRTIAPFGLYVNPNGYPDPGNSSQQLAVPVPTAAASSQSKLILLPGYRPIIQTLAGEQPLANGDYLLIQEIIPPAPSPARRVLLRARNNINTAAPWAQEGPDLPAGVTMVQAAGGHQTPTYFVGNNASLWKSHRNAQGNIDQWQQIVPGGGATIARKFFVNPYNASEIYIVDNNAVRHSTNGGTTWPVDAVLDSLVTAGGEFKYNCGAGHLDFDWCVLNDVVFDRQSPQTRFAVGIAGAFYSGDGTNWFRLLDTRALPSRPAGAYFNPITNANDRSLYIGFLGRGIMRCHPIPLQPPAPLPTPTAGLSPTPTPTTAPTLPWPPGQPLIDNGDFETGDVAPWNVSGVVEIVDERAHSGRRSLRMGTVNDSIDQLSQTVALPDDAARVTLTYWWFVESEDHQPWADTLRVLLQGAGGGATLEALTNSDPQFQWRQSRFDLSAYRGQQVTLTFRGEQNTKATTLFYLDDIRLDAHYEWQTYMPLVLRSYANHTAAQQPISLAGNTLLRLLAIGIVVVLMKQRRG